MGSTDDPYDLVADRYDRDAFEAEVETVRDDFHGLLDDRAAAMLVAAREGRLEAEPDDAILPGREVTFDATVETVHELRTFQRDGGQGKVLNVDVDRDGETVRLVFWDDDAERYRDLRSGEQVRIEEGFVKEGRYGIEVHLGDRGRLVREGRTPMPEGSERGPAATGERAPTRDLVGTLEDRDPTRTFRRDGGDLGFVTEVVLDTGEEERTVTLWDDAVRRIQEIPIGRPVALRDLAERDGELHSTDGTEVEGPGDGAVSLDAFRS